MKAISFKKLLRNLGLIMSLGIVVGSGVTYADHNSGRVIDSQSGNGTPIDINDHDDDRPTVDCRQFDGADFLCDQEPSCIFNHHSGICSERNPGRPPVSRCERLDGQPRACVQAGCSFDRHSGECRSRSQGRGFVCAAFEDYDDYHRDGHRGIGVTEYDARQAALGDCLRHHHHCELVMCRPL